MKNPVYDKKPNTTWEQVLEERALAGGSNMDHSLAQVVGRTKRQFDTTFSWENRPLDGEDPKDKYNDLGFRIVRNGK